MALVIAHHARLPFGFDPLIGEAKRRARRRRLIAATILLAIVGGAAGAAFELGSPQGSGASGGGVPRTPNPHDITAQNASETAVRGRLSVGGVKWTAYTYTSPLGRCLEIGARTGSVGGCGSTGSFTWGLGGLEVGHAWYAVAKGFAPAGADSARVELADGSKVPPAQTYVGNGVWFVVYPANAAARADDVTQIALLDARGHTVRAARPPSTSALVRAERQLRRDPQHG